MRARIMWAALAASLIATQASAGPAEDAALAPMHRFADNLNAGDMKAAGAAYAPDAVIVDEFAPFLWRGKAFAGWLADWTKLAAREGITAPHMELLAPTAMKMGKNTAYAVIPAHLTFIVNGKPLSADGTFSATFKHFKSGWRISAWAWAGKPEAKMTGTP